MALTDYRQALIDLLNLVSPSTLAGQERTLPKAEEERDRAQNFLDKFGPLRPLRQVREEIANPSDVVTVWLWGQIFGESLTVWTNTQEQNNRLNKVFKTIFNDPVGPPGEERLTALRVDVVAGTVWPVPRDLLDAMANELLQSRKSIARCAQCSRFFYRQYSHDKYCSLACGSEARRKGQKDWVAQKREAAKQLHLKKRRKAS